MKHYLLSIYQPDGDPPPPNVLEQARSPARATPEAELVPLPEQDRSRWDRKLIEEGHGLVKRCLRRNQPGPYQIQAAINAVHTDAATPADTDWSQILALYDQLLSFTPTGIVALNRAVAVAEIRGPRPALDLIAGLSRERYHVYHAIRADLLRRLGQTDQAKAAYQAAIDRTDNAAEIDFLKRQLQALSPRRHES
jgi:RNA polymerase sigma-70 factor, ECF subfamily